VVDADEEVRAVLAAVRWDLLGQVQAPIPGFTTLCASGEAASWPAGIIPRPLHVARWYRLLWANATPDAPMPAAIDGDPLSSFVKLASAPLGRVPRYVLAFARRWGVLGLCPLHELPAAHDPRCRATIEDPTWAGSEEVAHWLAWARLADAIVDAIDTLQDERPLLRDLERRALPNWPYPLGEDVQGQRFALARMLNRWLEWGGVRLVPKWGRFDMERRDALAAAGSLNVDAGGTAFGKLALSLTSRMASHRPPPIELCHVCGEPVGRKRRGRTGMRVFCGKPACRREGWRLAKLDQRAGRHRWQHATSAEAATDG
jgi:hypothetical protein